MSEVIAKEKAVIKQITINGMILKYEIELPDGKTIHTDTVDELGEMIKRLV